MLSLARHMQPTLKSHHFDKWQYYQRVPAEKNDKITREPAEKNDKITRVPAEKISLILLL